MNSSGNIFDPAFTLWDASLDNARTADELLRCDGPEVLKLQAPPKNKFKRQLSSDSDTQSAASVSQSSVPTWRDHYLSCRDVLDSGRSEVRYDHGQLQVAAVARTRISSTSQASSSASTFSPKKFKSVLGSKPSWDHAAVRAHSNASFSLNVTSQPSADRSPRQGPTALNVTSQSPGLRSPRHAQTASNITSQPITAAEAVAKSPARFPGNNGPLPGWKASQLHQLGTHIAASNNDPTLTADMLDANKGHNSRLTATQQPFPGSPIRGRVCDVTTSRRRCEPDIFVFPEATSGKSVLCQHIDEPDGLDDPMETEESYYRDHYRRLAQVDHVSKTLDAQHGFSRSYSNFLPTSVDARDISNVRRNVASSERLIGQQPGRNSSRNDSRNNCHSHRARQQSIDFDDNFSFSPPMNIHDNSTNKWLPVKGKGAPVVGMNQPPEAVFNFSNSYSKACAPDSGHNRYTTQHELDVFGQTNGKGPQARPRSSSYSLTDVLDTSQADDVLYYLEESGDMSCQTFAGSTTSRHQDGRRTAGARDRTSPWWEETSPDCSSGDGPLNTRADTNVCYVSLNESGSSASNDDMEHDCDDNNNTFKSFYQTVVSQYQTVSDDDYFDETDGRDKQLGHKRRPANRPVGAPHKPPSADWKTADSKRQVYSIEHHPHAHSRHDHKATISHGVLLTSEPPTPKLNAAKLLPTFTRAANSAHRSSSRFLSQEITSQMNDSTKGPRLLEETRNLKQLVSPHSQQAASAERRNVVGCRQYRAEAQCRPRGHGHVITSLKGDEDCADEVDGLGDEDKKSSTANSGIQPGPKESSQTTNVVSCFHGQAVTSYQLRTAQIGPDRGSHGSTSTIDTQQGKLPAAQVGRQFSSSKHEALQPSIEVTRRDRGVPMDEGNDLRTGTKVGQSCLSSDAQMRRRKSDTSIEDVTETCISRSQSSPSKLGVATSSCPERVLDTFHRPWQEQPSHGSHTLPRAQSIWRAITSSFPERNTRPKSDDHTTPLSHDLVAGPCQGHPYYLPEKCALPNIARPCQNSKGDYQGLKEDAQSRRNLLPRVSGEDRLELPQTGRLVEARPKRKLEFSAQDWVHEPTKREPYLASCDVRTVSGVMVDAGSVIQEGDDPSTSSAHQHTTCPRNDDEVDIRVQVLDVFQETTHLRQRLDRISQDGDRSCECRRIEQNILTVTLDLFRTIGSEASSRDNWMNEIRKTNQMIKDSLDLADNCRRLCRHGRHVTDVLSGSIIIRMRCRTLTSVVDLCHLHASGELHAILSNILGRHVPAGLTLRVTLDQYSVRISQEHFVSQMGQRFKTRRRATTGAPIQERPTPVTVARSTDDLLSYSPVSPAMLGRVTQAPLRSAPAGRSLSLPVVAQTSYRERKFSLGELSRTAFQELNISDVGSPDSPSYVRYLRDVSSPGSPSYVRYLKDVGSPGSPSYVRYLRDENHQALGKLDLTLTPPHQLNSPNILTSPRLLRSPGSSPLSSPRKLKLCDVISEQENIDQQND